MTSNKDFYSNLVIGGAVSLLALVGSYQFTHIVFEGKGYIANVAGKNITISEFSEKFGAAKKQQMSMGTDFKTENGRNQYFDMRKQVVQDIILSKYILSDAEKQNIVFTDAQVDQEIEKVKANNFRNSDEAFQKALRKNNFTIPKLKEVIKERNIVKLVLDKLITENVKVTEKDITDFYNAKKDTEFVVKETIDAAHILVKDEATAKAVLAELATGKNFDELAKKYSIDPGSKDKGGQLGFFKRTGDMVEEFAKAAWALENGAVTKEPVKTQFGYHIIKRIGYKPEEVTPLEKVKEKITGDLKNLKQGEFFTKWKEKTLKETEVKPNFGYEDFFVKELDKKPIEINQIKTEEKK